MLVDTVTARRNPCQRKFTVFMGYKNNKALLYACFKIKPY